ncbi:MAG: PA2169 family four-helix-bundle protein [Arenimonas sp.]
MNQSTELLDGLASAARDGKSFYELAAREVDNAELKTLFTRIAKVKGEIAAALATEIRAEGEVPAKETSWNAEITRLYIEVRAVLGDKNYTWVSQLEDSEDNLKKQFIEALADPNTSAHAHIVLTRFMPEVQSCHDLMRAQKLAFRAAA